MDSAPDFEKIEQASRCLKALANPIRLAILCALKDGEKNVQSLEHLVGTSQSNISMHLATMRDKAILLSRKDGNQVFYRVKDERMFELLHLLQSIYCKD
jgi:ArsR family transcriptional regulator